MKILMLPTFFGGVSWWRFEVPARALREAGHEVYCPTGDEIQAAMGKHKNDFFAWVKDLLPKYDIAHAGYNSDPQFGIGLFKARDLCGVPVITDIDDDLDSVPTYNKGWGGFHAVAKGQMVAKTQLRYSDAVTFSTEPLKGALGYLNSHSAVLGNWIDVESFDHATQPRRAEDRSIRIMMTGGSQRYGDWELYEEPLKWALNHYDGKDGKPLVRLIFVGATPDWVEPWISSKDDPHANRVFHINGASPVTLFCKALRYVNPDIMVSPVLTNTFNKSKSGLKFLESALAGAAFLCTDYPTYDIAPKGTCIKVSNTETQWKEALSALIEDTALRQKLASAARTWVLENADARTHISPRLTFYQEVISGGANLATARHASDLAKT